MRVVKVLNNSLVLALDAQGRETILMGKGIGYQKSIGYQFRENEIEKVFVLQDREVSKNIIRLAAETDAVYFEMAKNVIDYAIETFGMELMDHIYFPSPTTCPLRPGGLGMGLCFRTFTPRI